jgi:hypothetical protein
VAFGSWDTNSGIAIAHLSRPLVRNLGNFNINLNLKKRTNHRSVGRVPWWNLPTKVQALDLARVLVFL